MKSLGMYRAKDGTGYDLVYLADQRIAKAIRIPHQAGAGTPMVEIAADNAATAELELKKAIDGLVEKGQ